jgi:hypothetical protein
MNDWIKNLPPEDFIYMIGGFLLLVLVLIIVIKVFKLSQEISGRTLKLTEELMSINDNDVTNLKIVNRSYIDNEITEIGMIYKKRKVIILEDQTRVYARNKFEHVITHSDIRGLLHIEDFKIKRLKFYYENSIGMLIKSTGRVTRNKIKRTLIAEKKELRRQEKLAKAEEKRQAKEAKKARKAADKAQRYEEGNYTTCDRIKIFFYNLSRPIKKARHNAVIKRNKKIADKRAEKEVEEERERLIEQQRLIYEQQLRETRKEELRNEYKIDELKATLEEAEKNPEPFILEETDEPVKETKKEKRAKKQPKQKEIEELLEEEKIPEEEKVEESEPLTVEELLEESSEDETEKE